ncbi:hypothetical protein ACLE20_13410 [Rhizobium sp. YIM 134829]|uniref:hypothetical protein n=1 Tax=Rhizobium sp. YIM 134829 TaxID=3390453 RepID=UPI00397A2A1C
MAYDLATVADLQAVRAGLGIAVSGSGPLRPATKWGAALAAVIAGLASTTVLFAGDSTWMGVGYGSPSGAPTGIQTTGARPYTPVAAFAKYLQQFGVPASTDSFMGLNIRATDTIADYNAYNPNTQVDTATWTIGGTVSLGGNTFRKASTTLGPIISYDDEKSTRKMYVVLDNTVGATYAVKCDGATVYTYTATGAAVPVVISTPQQPEGFHTWEMECSSGLVSNVVGGWSHNDVTPRVNVINAGFRGLTSSLFADDTTAYTAMKVMPLLAPTLLPYGIGINDVRTGGANLTTAQIAANLAAVRARVTTADLLLASPHSIAPADDLGAGAKHKDLVATFTDRALAWSLNHFQIKDLIGSYNSGNRRGQYFDGLHVQDRSFADIQGRDLARIAISSARLS